VTEARVVAEDLGDARGLARCDHSLAQSVRRLGRFDDAAVLLGAAGKAYTALGDEAGLADVLQETGTVNAQRGDVAIAQVRYQESLAIRERLGDRSGVAALTNNLGIVAQDLGEMELARELGERALRLYTEIGEPRRIMSCQINLAWMEGIAGDHESSLRRCEEAIRLSGQVGDRLNRAIAENNMGDALRDLGRLEDAGRAYGAAAETYRDLNDTAPLMALFEDVAVLATRISHHADAFTLLGAADALRAVLGAVRVDGAEEQLAAQLAGSRDAIGDEAADSARRAGAALSLDEAIAVTLSLTAAPRR
jgi:tetratricopeptide (TPR) repeat protein